jgi:hypothetical protein
LKVPRLTFDTNGIINLFDAASTTATSVEELRTLIRYGLEGKAEIAVTTRVEADLEGDQNEARRASNLEALKLFPVISSIARWDVSKWDEDIWADGDIGRLNEEIQEILFPGLTPADRRFRNKINDVDHLTGHLIDGRDIFVTDDKGILRGRDRLRKGPGVMVMTPAQALEHIDNIVMRSAPSSLSTEGLSQGYHSRAMRGTVTFDYSNNNHRFALGEAQHFFETRWSKASNTAIHAYSDGASIEALAVAKGAQEIADVTDAEAYDYSSRVRTPQLGQVVVWRNINALYAATRIIRIADDTRGDDTDELTFEYVLLSEGGRDFSAS